MKKDQPLWFKGQLPADWVTRFTVGSDYLWDTLLLPYDIEATRAHVRGLAEIGVMETNEFTAIGQTLDRLRALVDAGDIIVRREDEDCHTVIERFVTAEVGDAGQKIHTGRSRNDQVLAALRLFLRDQIRTSSALTAGIATQLCDIGESHQTALMPGYTHLQRAMPSTAGLWAAGYAELLADDLDSMVHAFRRVNVSPLGSAAGYGVPFLDLPSDQVASDLGFERRQVNATTVQLSRGKIELIVVHACVQVAATINRLASDLVLFNTSEFGFVTLPEDFCTGSSIMPQKRNPDVLELARATYHRIVAEMHLLATLPANLPSGYHRDLQLTKESAMRAVTTTLELLTATGNVLDGVVFDHDRMFEACSSELMATANALRLVMEGVPFREAYRRAGAATDPASSWPDNLGAMYGSEGHPGRASLAPVRVRLEALLAGLDVSD